MKIAIIGTGYVGLVTGTCLADSGNDVTCVDIDQAKIERLEHGDIPIFEPGLAELIERNSSAGRLKFTTDTAAAVRPAQLVFIAVGTPMSDNAEDKGAADLKYVWSAVESFAPHLAKDAIVVIKSTVPVGTNTKVYSRLKELTGRTCDVASNPEFLKEGAAINDFQYPDRVVVGVRTKEAEEDLSELYGPFLRTDKPMLVMTPESAELTKYVANALLYTKSAATSTTSAAGLAMTGESAFSFSFPASATAEAAFRRTCGPWPTWPGRSASSRCCWIPSMRSTTGKSAS